MWRKLLFLGLIVLLLGGGCANVVSPTGGIGIKTPPVVNQVSVINGQTNFSDDNIELSFSTYMNRSLVTENLNVIPLTKYTYKWSGKDLTIMFTEALQPQTTYSVILGGNYSDHYGNIADSSFYVFFSTGDMIDSGKIQGKIYCDKTEGYYIFCYIISDKNVDTMSYLTQPADYRVQVGANGDYTVPALKDGKYRVLAVLDADKDGIITHTRDTIGVAPFDAIVSSGKSDKINIIPQSVIDTILPEMLDGKAINSNEIVVTFTEPIKLDSFDANCFYLTNKENDRIQTSTRYYYQKEDFNRSTASPAPLKELKIYFPNLISKDTIWYLAFDSSGIGTIRDMNENLLKQIKNIEVINETDSIYFEPDTTSIPVEEKAISSVYFSGYVKDDNQVNIETSVNKYLIFTDKKNNRFYQAIINSDNTFRFDSLDAGDYNVFYFHDINNNEKYDSGKLIPFSFAEPFVHIEKPITIKSKWNIDNYELKIKSFKK